MRLSISNLAWDIVEDIQIADLLESHNIDAIDIAPGKYFNDFSTVSVKEILSIKEQWLRRGVEIVGMQALLFGTVGLNLFSDEETQKLMLKHLANVCRIGGILGARRLVFGSPKNRDRGNLSDEEALEIAKKFFNQLGNIAEQEGVIICLEPNPICYGANFMTTHQETINIVKLINHDSIKMQLDIGAVKINQEELGLILSNHAHNIGHIHASEPNLVPFGDYLTDNNFQIYGLIKKYLSDHIVTIEMLQTENEPHLESINRAIIAAKNLFLPRNVL
ncbi:sugar phosphate isomerase/epimerase family protein [Thorsellia anophelis]|uniref:Sugar phosphate isomerase/epimerase n=1 Tax=Thorsellia anophelis DSM 18579 TaxID=1123402 RepID=A0A1I0FEX8_9GAMM|nr:sugar phosphate isomerase/epimerase [Thorsellia anophelis]SET56720.1 Sugar phosphate isomerase/epimerase [Thorsellia anophelis DSM 18579]